MIEDKTTNTGRKQRSLDACERVQFLVDALDSGHTIKRPYKTLSYKNAT